MRGTGDRPCRRRQFRRSGRGVSIGSRPQGSHDDPRRRPWRQHVALSDRAHRGHAEHRIGVQRRGGRAGRLRRRTARARALAQPAVRGREHPRYPQSVPVRRRRSCHRLARWLRCHARSRRLRGDRRAVRAKSGTTGAAAGTSVPGVFAVGDVRSGSVKRVGGAIGEGAQVVAALHGFLGDAAKPAL